MRTKNHFRLLLNEEWFLVWKMPETEMSNLGKLIVRTFRAETNMWSAFFFP